MTRADDVQMPVMDGLVVESRTIRAWKNNSKGSTVRRSSSDRLSARDESRAPRGGES